MKKLPTIDPKYWILMILATTIGEIVGNLISRNLGLGYTTGSSLLIGVYALAVAGTMYFKAEAHAFYWTLIVTGNIAGTNIADFIVISPLNLGAAWGSLLVMGLLSTVLVFWKMSAHGVSLGGATGRTTEALYWSAILMSSTFGTTSGDFLTSDTPLGALGGSVLLLGLLCVLVLLTTYTSFPRELAYWSALVIIHPVGATIGNYISKPIGLNFGNVYTSLFLTVAFLALYNIAGSKPSKPAHEPA